MGSEACRHKNLPTGLVKLGGCKGKKLMIVTRMGSEAGRHKNLPAGLVQLGGCKGKFDLLLGVRRDLEMTERSSISNPEKAILGWRQL